MAKAMSDQRLAALIYYGWTLKSASVDSASGLVAEYYLEWDRGESPHYPTPSEANQFSQLSVVDDVFEVPGRGVVIIPGFPREQDKQRLKVRDFVVLHDQLRDARLVEVRGIEFLSPPNPKGWPLLLGSALTKKDVKIGSVVWIRNQQDEAPITPLVTPAPSAD